MQIFIIEIYKPSKRLHGFLAISSQSGVQGYLRAQGEQLPKRMLSAKLTE